MNGKVFPLRGRVRHYAWGGSSYLPDLLGHPAGDQPWAEYWLGAHPNDPSEVKVDDRWQQLDSLIAADGNTWLGEESGADELPFLMKILDVDRPLSIQVHPNASQAAAGYARENALGLPLDDPNRNFKDANPKPELALALGDFWLLYGFRTEADCVAQLSAFPSLAEPAAMLKSQGLRPAFEHIMQADAAMLGHWLTPVFKQIRGRHPAPEDPAYWIGQWRELHATDEAAVDRGVMGFLLMNLVHLKRGDSIFQDANVMHAYLRGQCAEIMSNSDNVLRGGLTPKHVDIPQLLAHLDFSPPAGIASQPPEDISLTLEYRTGPASLELVGPTIAVALEGVIELDDHHLKAGEAAFVRGRSSVSAAVHEGGALLLGS